MKLSLRTLFAAAGLLVASAAQAEEISLAPKFEPFAAPQVEATDIEATDVNGLFDASSAVALYETAL